MTRTAIRFPMCRSTSAWRSCGRCTRSALGSASTGRRVPDDKALLGDPRGLGLLLGSVVELVRFVPFPEPVIVSSGGVEHAISLELAGQIGVT